MARYTTAVCLVLIAMLALSSVTHAATGRHLMQGTAGGASAQGQARGQRAQLDTQTQIRNAVKTGGSSNKQQAARSGTSNVRQTARPASGNLNNQG